MKPQSGIWDGRCIGMETKRNAGRSTFPPEQASAKIFVIRRSEATEEPAFLATVNVGDDQQSGVRPTRPRARSAMSRPN